MLTKEELQSLKEQVSIAIASGVFSGTKEQALAIVLSAHEHGIGPFTALRSMHLNRGKVTMSAHMLMGLALGKNPRHQIEVVENSAERCLIKATRDGKRWSEFSFTMNDARQAQLANGPMYKKYPAQMLLARCKAMTARGLFSDCVENVYTHEEVSEGRDPGPQDVPEAYMEQQEAASDQTQEQKEEQVLKFSEAIDDAASMDALNTIAKEMQDEYDTETPGPLSKKWQARKRTLAAVTEVETLVKAEVDTEVNVVTFLEAVASITAENPERYAKKRPSKKDIAAYIIEQNKENNNG